jgi:hypothetical protein
MNPAPPVTQTRTSLLLFFMFFPVAVKLCSLLDGVGDVRDLAENIS